MPRRARLAHSADASPSWLALAACGLARRPGARGSARIGRPGDGGDDRHVPADDDHDRRRRRAGDRRRRRRPPPCDGHIDLDRPVDVSRRPRRVDPDRRRRSTTGRLGPAEPPRQLTPSPGPAVPDATHPIDAAWVDPATQELLSVDDGTYWATVVGHGTGDGGAQFVTFRLAQAFFGDACTAQFGADACDNDLGTLESPTGTMPLFLGAGRITVADPSTQQSYAISGDVLFELIADPTAASARRPATSTPRSPTCCRSRAARSSPPSRSGPRSRTTVHSDAASEHRAGIRSPTVSVDTSAPVDTRTHDDIVNVFGRGDGVQVGRRASST